MAEKQEKHYWLTIQQDAQRTYDVRVQAKSIFDANANYKQANPGHRIIAVRSCDRSQD